MGLADLISADINSVVLNTTEFAEEVTRFPEGTGAGLTVAASVFIGNEEFDPAEGAWIRRGSVMVAASQDVHRNDKWSVRGSVHRVESLGVVDNGMKQFTFIVSRRTMQRR